MTVFTTAYHPRPPIIFKFSFNFIWVYIFKVIAFLQASNPQVTFIVALPHSCHTVQTLPLKVLPPPTPTEVNTVLSHRCIIYPKTSCCNATVSSAADTSLAHPSSS
jgi:hypothetical protein